MLDLGIFFLNLGIFFLKIVENVPFSSGHFFLEVGVGLGLARFQRFRQHPNNALKPRSNMSEWFLALAMLFLAIGHVLLIKKCASIESEITHHTDGLKTLMGEVRDLLDEALDLLADTPASSSLPAQMNPAESIPHLIFSTLLSRMNMGATDGST